MKMEKSEFFSLIYKNKKKLIMAIKIRKTIDCYYTFDRFSGMFELNIFTMDGILIESYEFSEDKYTYEDISNEYEDIVNNLQKSVDGGNFEKAVIYKDKENNFYKTYSNEKINIKL